MRPGPLGLALGASSAAQKRVLKGPVALQGAWGACSPDLRVLSHSPPQVPQALDFRLYHYLFIYLFAYLLNYLFYIYIYINIKIYTYIYTHTRNTRAFWPIHIIIHYYWTVSGWFDTQDLHTEACNGMLVKNIGRTQIDNAAQTDKETTPRSFNGLTLDGITPQTET